MGYYGNQPTVGQNQSFKVLDDISSYTETFDATSTAVVSAANDTLTFYDHRFVQGQRVTYTHGGGAVINGLTTATAYYIIRQDKDTIQLAENATNAANGSAIDISLSGTSGTAHTLNIAFDGTNTKFKATYQTGYHVKLTRAAQLQIAINGVVQEPVDSTSPSNGFGIDSNNVIVLSAAPVSTDDFWGTFLASNLPSWEISDNKVDNFDGNGTATTFTLSKLPANNENVLVTINGVVQHPSDATTTRAYKLIGQEIVFTSAPLTDEAIQVRHIGFAGAAAGGVTGFYGRTGNVTLTSADDVTINNITGAAATFTGNVSIGGTLTYTDVTNIDAVGIITAQEGIHLGIGATAGKFLASTGITTFSTSVGIADSIHKIGNTDTSIRFPGDDTFTVETGGSEVVRADSSQNFGVGTASPTARLDVRRDDHEGKIAEFHNSTGYGIDVGSGITDAYISSGYNQKFIFKTDPGSGQKERIRILQNGRIGIGTDTVPRDMVRIHNPAANASSYIQFTNENTGGMTLNDGTLIGISQNNSNTDGTGSGFTILNKENAEITLGTNNLERLRITSTGKVGMGTPANNGPTAPLHIYGGSDTTPIIAFTRSTSHDDWQGGGIGLVDEGGTYKGALTFYTHSSSGTKNDSITEKLRITSKGYREIRNFHYGPWAFVNDTAKTTITVGDPGDSKFTTVKLLMTIEDVNYRQGYWQGEYTIFASNATGGPGVDYHLHEHWQQTGSTNWSGGSVSVAITSGGALQVTADNGHDDAQGNVWVHILDVIGDIDGTTVAAITA